MTATPTDPGPLESRAAEELFAEFLGRHQRGEEPDIEALCREHPEHAELLKRRHASWLRAGRALQRLGVKGAGGTGAELSAVPCDTQALAHETSDGASLFWSRYTVQDEIGRGGMGSILSVRDEDFGRELAMKVLRSKGTGIPGRSSGSPRHDRARFFEEARITGRLQHPSIVPVHELGVNPEGRPYFTMKLVEGRTFREILALARSESEGWSIQRALGVLLRVCEAVGFAHDKGVIHRDLKPSNLMVGSFGEVYVMDWGLARDMKRSEPERAEEVDLFRMDSHEYRTYEGDVIGTPEYMSPEQATGRREDIGPRSDVFAVGAMLYELLTGQSPHDTKGSKSPFVRLAAAIGSNHVDVKRLAPETPAELCAICEQAIAHDPEDRYDSMLALAVDLRAFLEGRVVQAYATGAWAELRKWVKRNPTVASLGGALVAIVVLGLMIISGLALRVSQQNQDLEEHGEALTRANSQLLVKSREATENFELARQREIDANQARALAEKREREALAAQGEAHRRAKDLEAVTEFQSAMLHDIDAELMGVGMLAMQREQVVASLASAGTPADEIEQRLAAYEDSTARINPTDLALTVLDEYVLSKATETIGKKFVRQPTVEADLRRSTGRTYLELGVYPQALEQLERALELGRSQFGDTHVETLQTLDLMGTVLERLGRPQEAETYYLEAYEASCSRFGADNPRTLGFLNNLAILMKSMNRFDEAEAAYREALRGRRLTLGNEDPGTLGTIGNLGGLLAARGQYDEAEALHREALSGNLRRLGPDDLGTLTSYNNLGHLLKSMHRYAEAFPYYEAALLGRRRLLGDLHPDTLTSLNNFGLMLKTLRDYEGAEVYYREALEGRRLKLAPDHPDTLVSINNMGSLLKALKRLDEAEPYYREALEGNRRLYGDRHQTTLVFKNNLAALLKEMGRLEEARELSAEVLAMSEIEQGREHPLTLHFTWSLGSIEGGLGAYEDAEERLRDGLQRLRGLERHSARLEEAFLKDLGKVLFDSERWSDAEIILLERHAVAKKKAISEPSEAYRVEESIEALVALYDEWSERMPSGKYDVQARAWRSQLAGGSDE